MATWHVTLKEWYSERPRAVKALVIVAGGGAACAAGLMAAPELLGAASAAGLLALLGEVLIAEELLMAIGTAIIAAIAALLGAGATAGVSRAIDEAGKRSRAWVQKARAEEVSLGDIRFEGC